MAKFEEFIKGFEESPKEELLDAYGLATPYGRKVSSDFLKENKIGDIYKLSNDEYNSLAKKAMEKFGIKDLELAQEFIQSNDESDKLAHNKKISEINRLYEKNKISKDDYWKRINEEADSFNKLQEKWKD
jgi:hypothetical protein